VRAHQAVGVAPPFVEHGGRAQELQEVEAIKVVVEQLPAKNRSCGCMESAISKLTTRNARHVSTLAAESPREGKACLFRRTSWFEQ